MTKHDRNKLLAAGYTILRECNQNGINFRSYNEKGSWTVWKSFPTQKARKDETERINEHQSKIIFE